MSRRFRLACGVVPVVVAVTALAAPRAFAIQQFHDQFVAKYVTGKEGTPLATAVAEAKCNVCHVAGESKKNRNAYGQALAERLDKKEDAKNVEKIQQALDEVAALPSKVAGKTFGDLLAAGTLPGTE